MKKLLLCIVTMLLLLPVSGMAQNYQVFTTSNSSLPYNPIYSIDFDRNGNIWFGGQRNAATGVANVSKLSRDLSQWTVFQPIDLALDQLEDRVFYAAVDDQNTKWFCTHYGVSYLKADGTSGYVDFTKDAYTRTVETDSKGNVYISIRVDANRADSRIYVSSDHGATWTAWGLPDIGFSLGPADARPEIYDLRNDSKGQMWLCTYYGVTYRKLDGTWKSLAALEGKYTYGMTIDPNDHVWVPNNTTRELYEILPDETIITHDSTKIAALKYTINDLESDFNGHLWLATNGGGLIKLMSNGSFQQFNAATTGGQIPQDNLTHMEIHNNVIWVSTADQGIVRIEGLIDMGQDYLFTASNSSLPYNPIYCIDFDRNGNIWFGGQRNAATGIANVSKLSRDLSQWTVFQPAELALDQLEDRVFFAAVDDQNTKWFCTHYGVSYLKADGTTGFVDFTKDAYTRTVETDAKGNVYISLRVDANRADSRIYVSSDHGATWTAWGLPDIGFSLGPSAARPEIYDLRDDSKGQLWLCTYYGVTYRKLDGTWKCLTPLEGKYTYGMTIDPNDHVWVPNNDTRELYEILPDETIITHDSTQIAALRYPINDLEADFNGNLWLATNGGGLIKLMPDGSFEQFNAATTSGKIPQDNLTHMEIKNNVIWASTADQGIVRLANLINKMPTAVFDRSVNPMTPMEFALLSNYPNPFNPSTQIRFDLAKNEKVELAIYNTRGELVKIIASGNYPAGSHLVMWDGRDRSERLVPSGIYLYKLKAGDINMSRKMTLIK